jgi:hypothetical protein
MPVRIGMAKQQWFASPFGEFDGIALSLPQCNVYQSHGLRGEVSVTIYLFPYSIAPLGMEYQ